MNIEVFTCTRVNCQDSSHHNDIDCIYLSIRSLLLECTSEFSFDRVKKVKVIPGWNRYVKDLHNIAREAFLNWKGCGKPLNGPYMERMRETRRQFKIALENCKRNENQIRRENMLRNLDNKNY